MATCSVCGKTVSRFDLFHGVCDDCRIEQSHKAAAKRQQDEAEAEHARVAREDGLSRIILTTETSHNLPVTERLGIVTAECVLGMNMFRDIAASLRDVVGGRSQTMQRGLREARETALDDLRAQALDLGADAVVGVALDYSEISGGGKSMLFLVASGTAVRLAEDS